MRSVVLKYGEIDDVFASIAKELKIPHDILTDHLDVLRESPACRLAKMPEHLQVILRQRYQNTWLSVEHVSVPANTCTGSKPGMMCADDFVFMIAFTKDYNRIRQELIQIAVLTKISFSGGGYLRSTNINERPASLYVRDTSFADDLVLAIVITQTMTLPLNSPRSFSASYTGTTSPLLFFRACKKERVLRLLPPEGREPLP